MTRTHVPTFADRTLALHDGGKIEVTPKFSLEDRDRLSMAYTPGVGTICEAIAEEPERGWDLTIKRNAVAILTDGSAVLGLGDVGPLAALPVMEGKAMLFKQLAGIDAYPICARTSSLDELVALGEMIEPGFGGINIEDVAAPGCFEVERRLQATLDIPVFHDDQHGTATVVLAALLNACSVTGRRVGDLRVALLGVGAAGVACARILVAAGVGDLIAVDRPGILHPGLAWLDPDRRWVVEHTNAERRVGNLEDALRGADALIGVSGPRLVRPEWLRGMRRDAVVFALANPVPEIMPEEVPDNVRVVATGRSDYPNQINNALVFPGFFRGLLDARARTATMPMKLAAARAIADVVAEDACERYLVPSILDHRVAPTVAAAVRATVEHAPTASSAPVIGFSPDDLGRCTVPAGA
jgi:malate dehydrogenase (oxaloacetate-decarboxylating)